MDEGDSDDSEGDLACFFRRNEEEGVEEEEGASLYHRTEEGDATEKLDVAGFNDVEALHDVTSAVVLSEFCTPGLGSPVMVVQQPTLGIGFQLWPAAGFLCRFLEDPAHAPKWLPEGKVGSLQQVTYATAS